MKYIITLIFFVGTLLYAGESDYNDSVVTEMKNNGYYYELSEKYPNASETDLIKIYLGTIKNHGYNRN